MASGPDLRSSRPPALGCLVGAVGLRTQADALASPSWRVPRERPSPRWGGLCRCHAARPPRGCVSVPRWTLGGAPGVLQVVPQVPEAERWCRFPSTLCPPRVPAHGGVRVSHEWLFVDGGGRDGERSIVCSPRRGSWRMRPCGGRGAGSAPDLAVHTLLCGHLLTHTAGPPLPPS